MTWLKLFILGFALVGFQSQSLACLEDSLSGSIARLVDGNGDSGRNHEDESESGDHEPPGPQWVAIIIILAALFWGIVIWQGIKWLLK